jgi:hypothetical protein
LFIQRKAQILPSEVQSDRKVNPSISALIQQDGNREKKKPRTKQKPVDSSFPAQAPQQSLNETPESTISLHPTPPNPTNQPTPNQQQKSRQKSTNPPNSTPYPILKTLQKTPSKKSPTYTPHSDKTSPCTDTKPDQNT